MFPVLFHVGSSARMGVSGEKKKPKKKQKNKTKQNRARARAREKEEQEEKKTVKGWYYRLSHGSFHEISLGFFSHKSLWIEK